MAEIFLTDHDEIRAWIEEHGGTPALVKDAPEEEGERADLLHVIFDGAEADMEELTWDEFFERFDNENLALTYDNEMVRAEGEPPEFEFVDREREVGEALPDTELPDSGEGEVLRENIYPDAPEVREGEPRSEERPQEEEG